MCNIVRAGKASLWRLLSTMFIIHAAQNTLGTRVRFARTYRCDCNVPFSWVVLMSAACMMLILDARGRGGRSVLVETKPAGIIFLGRGIPAKKCLVTIEEKCKKCG